MAKFWGTFMCRCGIRVSLAGFGQAAHERGRRHREALNGAGPCGDCGQRSAGERDPESPFCGRCDPNGARFFDMARR